MSAKLYEGSHRDLFQLFLKLVDDSEAQTNALLDLTTWEEVNSILSVGGGMGIVEATLLRQALPQAKMWYLDPSVEQCQAFRQYMQQENLLERVEAIAETTFQEYAVDQQFDRIVSMFSWFYIGVEERWLYKLLSLLNTNGTACIVLPNIDSIEADFNRSLSPDERTTLVGDELVQALATLPCEVSQHIYTKWIPIGDMLTSKKEASEASLAFAGFVALRSIDSFSATETQQIVDLIKARQEPEGIPMRWDVIVVRS